jgi:hypothetical protein
MVQKFTYERRMSHQNEWGKGRDPHLDSVQLINSSILSIFADVSLDPSFPANPQQIASVPLVQTKTRN